MLASSARSRRDVRRSITPPSIACRWNWWRQSSENQAAEQPVGWAWFIGSSASRQNKSCTACNYLVAKQYKSYVYYDDHQLRKGTVLLWRRRAHLLLSLLLQNLV